MMTLNEYQTQAYSTSFYQAWEYPYLGLASEAGEVCDKVKKYLRDGGVFPKDDVVRELGDVLWYIANIAKDLGITLDEVASINIDKLSSRRQRNRLSGSGDNR
jgi:NTP pyrophosphatase (non-canonical NTP hydrolase)